MAHPAQQLRVTAVMAEPAGPLVARLRDEVNETVHLVVLDGADAVFLLTARIPSSPPAGSPSRGRRRTGSLGVSLPLMRLARDRVPELTAALRESAAAISALVG
jgi:DNA-binding IclR family transcriptional regulator